MPHSKLILSSPIKVRVIPGAGRNEIKKTEHGLKAYLTAPPVGGKANKALLKLLAAYFNLKKSRLSVLKGAKSRNKVIRVE